MPRLPHCYSLLLALVCAGCDLIGANKATNHKKRPLSAEAASANSVAAPLASAPHALPSASALHAASSANPSGAASRYVLPFAWENSDNEPLARTRDFVKDVLRDNQEYMKHGPKFFEAFAKAQHPRSTVIACSDSRVQNAAWDVTPENDDFTIRNIGNQLPTSEGSVEYGIEHLGTPVLLIVGHTGCGAIKAAMGDRTNLSPAVRREIDSIELPKELLGQTSDAAWSQAVIANVHAQVKAGLTHFGRYVAEGRLTVIGAVYDFRNDLKNGVGRLAIVDVNGNSEPARLDAFVAAISGPKRASGPESPPPNNTQQIEASGSIEQIAKRIEDMSGLQVNKAPAEH